jgi:hypothetical protein
LSLTWTRLPQSKPRSYLSVFSSNSNILLQSYISSMGSWPVNNIRQGELRGKPHGALSINTSDLFQLKKAKKDGRLAEALLDRRAKLKRCVLL